MERGTVFDIRRFSIHDGPGIRTAVFFKGCPLSCWWCHNPESQRGRPEVMAREQRCIHCGACVSACPQGAISIDHAHGDPVVTDRERCTRCGACVKVCPSQAREIVGSEWTSAAVLAEIERDIPFFDESGGGVTFTGGEPLMQPAFLMELLRGCRALELHTALDTSGFAAWDVLEPLLPLVDLFLFDVKAMDPEKHRAYTGVSNDLILENLKKLSTSGAQIIFRVPVIPDLNDDLANLRAIGSLARSLAGVRRVDLLAYHAAAVGKYEHLGMDYRLKGTRVPREDEMNIMADLLRTEFGLQVKLGG
jgi:pyruvate formate lyase activating enzyme